MGSTPELHVLHGVNAAYTSQDLLHQSGLEHASTGMPDQRTACAPLREWTRQLDSDPRVGRLELLVYPLLLGVVPCFVSLSSFIPAVLMVEGIVLSFLTSC